MSNTADAIVVIDLQKGICFDSSSIHELETVTALVNERIKTYETIGKPVIFVQHEDDQLVPGTKPWELLSELSIPEHSYFVRKTHANSFYKTNLSMLLTELDCHSIELCGAQTEYCIDTTVKFAQGLGYQLMMCRGATTTYDNPFMKAKETIAFYEKIWDKRFLTFLEQ
ncbi:TPA: cysteine hydrolase family protein [Enterococcus faecium]